MTRRKDPEIAAEWIRGAFGWIVILLAAILVVPVAIIAGIGFAQGTIPSSDAGGIFGSGPGYPAFPPPFWLLWIPALGALALSVATWRFRGQFMYSIFSARWDLAIVAIFGASTTLASWAPRPQVDLVGEFDQRLEDGLVHEVLRQVHVQVARIARVGLGAVRVRLEPAAQLGHDRVREQIARRRDQHVP